MTGGTAPEAPAAEAEVTMEEAETPAVEAEASTQEAETPTVASEPQPPPEDLSSS